jgi:hypothetical protein
MSKRILLIAIFSVFVLGACSTPPPSSYSPTLSPDIEVDSSGKVTSTTCLLGTWKVDVDDYVKYVNSTPTRESMEIEKVNQPFYYVFNPDWSYTMYYENIVITANASLTGTGIDKLEVDITGKVPGTYSKVDDSFASEGQFFFKFATADTSQMNITDMKLNGTSLGSQSVNLGSLFDPAQYTKVAYQCNGDTLKLKPISDSVPKRFFTMTRDSSWTPPSAP